MQAGAAAAVATSAPAGWTPRSPLAAIAPGGMDAAIAADELAMLKRSLAAAGHELVGAREARHMKALVDRDPYPTEGMIYRFVDLERGTPYPSPIDPRGRWLTLDACWRFATELSHDARHRVEEWIEEWSRLSLIPASAFSYEFDHADYTPTGPGWFVRLQLVERGGDPLKSTNERLQAFLSTAAQQFSSFDAGLSAGGIDAKKATREYWRALCAMDFRDRSTVRPRGTTS